jgi:hypothetical protein
MNDACSCLCKCNAIMELNTWCVTVNIPMYYSNSTIVNIYWHCRKLVYEIIVNRGGYKISYFVASYRVYSPYIYNYYPTASYKIIYSVATLSYDNCYANLRDYSNFLLCDLL